MLMVARLVLGLAIGHGGGRRRHCYMAESAPLEASAVRMVATYQLAITVGIVGSYVTGLLITGPGTWRRDVRPWVRYRVCCF